MITRLRFVNYRSHEDSVAALRPINLLVGPAAAGKSNLFKGLVLVQNSIHRTLIELFPPGIGEFNFVRTRWADQTAPIGFEVELEGLRYFEDERVKYALKIATSPAGLYVLEETLQRRSENGEWRWVFQREDKIADLGEFGNVDPYEPSVLHRVWHVDKRVEFSGKPGACLAREVARELSSFGYYHLDALALKSLGTGQPSDRIGYDGSRLPDFIAWTKFSSENVAVYEAIREEMRELLPELDSIIVTQVQSDRQGLAFSFKGQRGYVAAPDLSDGTLLTLGLLALVHGPKQPALLCIEEPETGIHPRRIRWLFDRFLRLAYPAAGRAPVQVLMSTHSPYLVDLFSDMQECVHVVEQSKGKSRISSLSSLVSTKLHEAPQSGESIGHLWATGLYEGL